MKLQELPQDVRKEMSFIEIAENIFNETRQPMPFQELVSEIGKFLDLNEEELRSRMVQFYTDLNVDGRFLALGENRWGLREWYPFDQVDEEIPAPVKPKKKKKSKKRSEDDELLLELEEEDLDYDEDELEDDDEEDDEEESLDALEEDEEEFDDEDDLLDDDYELEEEEDELDFEEEEDEE